MTAQPVALLDRVRELEEAVGRMTPGELLRDGATLYSLEHAGWRKGVEQFQNKVYLRVTVRNDDAAEDAYAAGIVALRHDALPLIADLAAALAFEQSAYASAVRDMGRAIERMHAVEAALEIAARDLEALAATSNNDYVHKAAQSARAALRATGTGDTK